MGDDHVLTAGLRFPIRKTLESGRRPNSHQTVSGVFELTDARKPFRLAVVAHLVVWAILAMMIVGKVLLPSLNAGTSFGIFVQPTSAGAQREVIELLDFPYLLNFTRETLLNKTALRSGTSAYSLENHINVTRNWVNRTLKEDHYWSGRQFAMPFGYSPTMLCLLSPLSIFPANIAFVLFNMAGLFAVWWMTHPVRCRYGVGLLSFFSPLAFGCFLLGQTALISGACLLFIAERNRTDKRSADWSVPVLAGAALWVLTAKPPLAVAAAAVLLGSKSWRPLMVAGVLTLLTTVMISPYLGAGWMTDYIQLLLSYDKVNADPVLSWSLNPETMSNLRAILSVDAGLPDNMASSVSGALWLVLTACLAVTARRSGMAKSKLWALGILAYLLFCPHLTSTEELQLVLLLPLCVSSLSSLNRQGLILCALLPVLPFLSPVGALFQDAHLALFAAKLILVPLIVSAEDTDRAFRAS